MPTVVVGVIREMFERTPAPRSVVVRFRLGQVFGEPGNAVQQRAVLADALSALMTVRQVGTIVELPYRWKRGGYVDPIARLRAPTGPGDIDA
jgi:D-proline reductase (dithiol) PrdB